MDEQGDVLSPLAQRRKADGEDVEAVVEVLAERFVLDFLEQVAIGGGDDADVDGDGGGAAHAIELALLQDPEQFYLGLRGKFADLVEEDGAAVGELESAQTPGDGPAEGAFFVAEQFALHQTGWQRGAVHLDERLVLALARGMDGAGDQFLARTGFAGDEHRGVGGSDAAHVVEHLHQGGTAADDLLEIMSRFDLFLEIQVLLLEAGPFALGQYPIGDVDKKRPAGPDDTVLVTARLHPHVDP